MSDKKLAAENNVAKYLRYAIGEIFLVVIGILSLYRLIIGMKTEKNV